METVCDRQSHGFFGVYTIKGEEMYVCHVRRLKQESETHLGIQRWTKCGFPHILEEGRLPFFFFRKNRSADRHKKMSKNITGKYGETVIQKGICKNE